ncbi:MAG: putative (di)nucleoside polyphosphate hydrolase [Gammaproteobacteria bacterium]|nr:putative (di)nucleoside polyphosphate hydrolase [Gammaproteobacteria bacterium]
MPHGTTQLMSDVIDSDGFRANVGIVLMRGAGDAFLGRQVGGRGWQFPQGGVLAGERLEQAAYRELYEEIGLSPSDVELIGQTARWLRYRLPAKYVRRNRHPMCIGQKQRWFLLRLKREEAQFDFGRTSEPEFDQYRWVNFWEPVREVIYFKRAVYVRALTELAPIAFPDGPPPHPSWWAETAASALNPRRSATAPID